MRKTPLEKMFGTTRITKQRGSLRHSGFRRSACTDEPRRIVVMATQQSTSNDREESRPRRSGASSSSSSSSSSRRGKGMSTETIIDIVERLGVVDLVIERLRGRIQEMDTDEMMDEVTGYLKRNPEVLVVALGTITIAAGV